jgi:hypothetical protein
MFQLQPNQFEPLEKQFQRSIDTKITPELTQFVNNHVEELTSSKINLKQLLLMYNQLKDVYFPNLQLENNTYYVFEESSIVIQLLPIVHFFPLFPVDRVRWNDIFKCQVTHGFFDISSVLFQQHIGLYETIDINIQSFNQLSTTDFNSLQINFCYKNTRTNQIIQILPNSFARSTNVIFSEFSPYRNAIFKSFKVLESGMFQLHSFDDFPSTVHIDLGIYVHSTYSFLWHQDDILHRNNNKPSSIVFYNQIEKYEICILSFESDCYPSSVSIRYENNISTSASVKINSPYLLYFQQKFVPNGTPNFIRYNSIINRRYFGCHLRSTVQYLNCLFDNLISLYIQLRFLDRDTFCHILHFNFSECPLSLLYLFLGLVVESVNKHKPNRIKNRQSIN